MIAERTIDMEADYGGGTMDACKRERPEGRVKIFLQDGQRVIGRDALKLGEDSDFLFILNENNQLEALPKRLVVRYLEAV